MSKRALRRHHQDRIKNKCKKILKRIIDWRRIDDKDIGKAANHQVGCSCPLCGNPRRWYGEKTIQEIRAEQEYGQ